MLSIHIISWYSLSTIHFCVEPKMAALSNPELVFNSGSESHDDIVEPKMAAQSNVQLIPNSEFESHEDFVEPKTATLKFSNLDFTPPYLWISLAVYVSTRHVCEIYFDDYMTLLLTVTILHKIHIDLSLWYFGSNLYITSPYLWIPYLWIFLTVIYISHIFDVVTLTRRPF